MTGAGGGLGAGFARVLAGLGAQVVLADVNAAAVEAAADGVGVAVVTDVRDPEAVQALAERVWRDHGEVGVLVNNAAVEHVGRIWERPPDAWHRVVDVNLTGVYHGIHAFVPRMIDAGTDSVVLNVSSVGALLAGALHTAYQVTKQGVLVLSEGLAAELAAIGSPIQVSVALPGAVLTRLYADADATSDAEAKRGDMRAMLENDGIEPEAAAAMLLEQVAEGRFVVTTDPDAVQQMATRRIDRLRELFLP